MDDKPFSQPITISFEGRYLEVTSVKEAIACLLESWPEERGPYHRDALDTCYKVLDGHRSTVDAETAFRQALVEARNEVQTG